MSIIELIKIEFMKVKRSMILPLLLIPPILVVVSGVSSISMYMTPEYTNAWSAMFIQSALLLGDLTTKKEPYNTTFENEYLGTIEYNQIVLDKNRLPCGSRNVGAAPLTPLLTVQPAPRAARGVAPLARAAALRKYACGIFLA